MKAFLMPLLALTASASFPPSALAKEVANATANLIPAAAITVDGKLSEPLYNKAAWQSYPQALPDADANTPSTRFSLHLDDSHLYISGTIDTSDQQVVAKVTDRDGRLSREDSVEFFLQCGADPSEGYQFIINALGTVADYQLVQGGLLGADSYHADLRAATRQTDKGWQFEMAIPLAQLSIDASRKSWGLQLATNEAARKESAARMRSWAPVSHSLRALETFGTLKLPDNADFSRFAWRVHLESPVIISREGQYVLQNRGEIENDTKDYRIIHLSLELPGQATPAGQKIGIAPGKRSQVFLETSLGETDHLSGQLVYRLSEQAPGEGLLKQITAPVELRYTPWELQLIDPGYRQTIFATQKLTHLRARLLRTDPEADSAHLGGGLTTTDGQELPATFTPAGEHTWEVSIAGLNTIPDGKHRLSLSVGEGEGQHLLQREITKLPYQEGEVWIDALGVVRREGVAIPFYGYCFGNWLSLEKEWLPGFEPNLAGPVASWGEGEQRFESQLKTIDHLKNLGIYSLIDVSTANSAWRAGGERRKLFPLSPLKEAEKAEYRESIARLKGNPQVIAYYLADEPELHQQTPRRLGQVADLYREGDPYKPVLIVNNTYNGLIDFLPTSDIMMPDRYPVFRQDSGASTSIAAIEAHLNAVPVGKDSYQARWTALQAFDYAYFNIPNGRAPTAREMRSQQISALIGGATGITWYRQTNIYDHPGIISSLVYLEKEFRWVFETRQHVLPRAVTADRGLQCAVLEGNSGPILLVVNPAWESVEARIRDPLLRRYANWKIVGTDSSLSTEKGSLSLSLKPHESAILIPSSSDAPDLDWLAVEREEARLIAESTMKGNIAHASTGTIAIAFPETAIYPHSAKAVIDGMKSPKASGYAPRPFRVGEGVELRFPAPAKPKKMLIYETNITKGQIEIHDGTEWKKVASYERPWSEEPLEIALPGEEAVKLRLTSEEVDYRFLPNQARIVEIEVYE